MRNRETTHGRKLAIAAAAVLALAAGSAFAGIASTKHNLTSTGPGPNKVSAGDSNQICVFCHTPHGADTSASVPLWNKKLGSNTYSVYNSGSNKTSSLDGEVISVGSVSLACLSCHDGTQAMDNIINAPGSGGYDATGGGASGRGYTWSGSGVDSDGLMLSGPVPKIGVDLTDDHPIGIPYCGGSTNYASGSFGTCNDQDFVSSGWGSKTVNGQVVYWLDTVGTGGTAGVRDKTDIIFYTRTFSGGDKPSVECGSCHDPHVESKGTDNISFMRVTTSGSAICLACHVK